jgi:hypothetical protein
MRGFLEGPLANKQVEASILRVITVDDFQSQSELCPSYDDGT